MWVVFKKYFLILGVLDKFKVLGKVNLFVIF